MIAREGTRLAPNRRNPLVGGLKDMALATYLQSQIASFAMQLRLGLRRLFPKYLSLVEESITWRLTETVDEPMHFDFFDEGKPMRPEWRDRHRLKLFINIDSQPRTWHVSLDLPGLLKHCRAEMPDELLDDSPRPQGRVPGDVGHHRQCRGDRAPGGLRPARRGRRILVSRPRHARSGEAIARCRAGCATVATGWRRTLSPSPASRQTWPVPMSS